MKQNMRLAQYFPRPSFLNIAIGGGQILLICVRGGVVDQTGLYVLRCRRSVGPSQGIRLPL